MRIINWCCIVILFALATACGSVGGQSVSQATDNLGTLSLTIRQAASQQSHRFTPDILLSGGQSLNEVTWVLTSGGSAYRTGSEDVNTSNSGSVFDITGIAPETNYAITLTGTTTDGLVTCTGTNANEGADPAEFTVTSNNVTEVTVIMSCTEASGEAGGIAVVTTTANCTNFNYTVVSENPVLSGNTVTNLYASVSVPNVPGISAVAWNITSAPQAGEALGVPQQSDATDFYIAYQCPTARPSTTTITLRVIDTDSFAECPNQDLTTYTITCD